MFSIRGGEELTGEEGGWSDEEEREKAVVIQILIREHGRECVIWLGRIFEFGLVCFIEMVKEDIWWVFGFNLLVLLI